MSSLLYLHGFLSSPHSLKAQQVKYWLEDHRPDINYHCPQLPPYPDECGGMLNSLMEQLERPVGIIGSSMGGFWATWLVEFFEAKAVLINPLVDVLRLMPGYLNRELHNYHLSQSYQLSQIHLQQFKSYIIAEPRKLQNYWLLLQTGDKTLDYRLAVAKYRGCRQTVELDGDHSFQNFERHLGAVSRFLFE